MTRNLAMAAVAALVTLGTACSGTTESPTSPSPTGTNTPIFYTAIGASDGIGFGGSAPCIPLAPECPSGTGYVQILNRRLMETGRTFGQKNLSIPGAVLSKSIEDLAASIGRPISSLARNFVDGQAPFVPTNTTHVTIFAGGNDSNVIAQAVLAGRGGSNINAFIDAQVQQWGTDYEALVAAIRARAPNARIVGLNLPNLAGSPYVQGNSVSERSVMQRIAVGLSDRVNAMTGRNVLVVDLMCDPRIYLSSSYASDGFHPNDTGYAVFADLTLPALRDGANNQPSTSCSQRRVVP